MGYHPETMVFSFPPYPRNGRLKVDDTPRRRRTFAEWLYDQSPWLGFTIWHIDPERAGTGNRRDDSCGWFDRSPGPYAAAVKATLKDPDIVQHVANTVEREVFWRSAYLADYPPEQRGWNRVTPADAMALTLMVGHRLEHLRWLEAYRTAPLWLRPFVRKHNLDGLLIDLALNPGDNIAPSKSSHDDHPKSFVLLLAGAMHRHIKPWWRHPRWHLHHWQVQFNLGHNLRRAFVERCTTCNKTLSWNSSAIRDGLGLHHSACYMHQPTEAKCPTTATVCRR